MTTTNTNTDPIKLGEKSYNIQQLARQYPPEWQHPNKQLVADIVKDDSQQMQTTSRDGTTASMMMLTVSRWKAQDLPQTVVNCPHVIPRAGFFQYPTSTSNNNNDDSTNATTIHWHMNFADVIVFGHAEGALLAQDELQVVEHPILCSLGKAMAATGSGDGLDRLTKEHGVATPVLVRGAPRRCRLLAHEHSIYGDHFAHASGETIERAVECITPPTLSNILAIEALNPCYGMYNVHQIAELLGTAYAGFRAVVLTSSSSGNSNTKEGSSSSNNNVNVTMHTGHWGCGAYGGNKGLIAAIQILAAGMAGIRTVEYWYGYSHQDMTALEHGIQVANLLNDMSTLRAVELLDSAGYAWGIANENHVLYEPPKDCLLSRASDTRVGM